MFEVMAQGLTTFQLVRCFGDICDALEFLGEMCTSIGFDIDQNDYVHRDQENKKQELELNRVFLQAKLVKQTNSNENETQQ